MVKFELATIGRSLSIERILSVLFIYLGLVENSWRIENLGGEVLDPGGGHQSPQNYRLNLMKYLIYYNYCFLFVSLILDNKQMFYRICF